MWSRTVVSPDTSPETSPVRNIVITVAETNVSSSREPVAGPSGIASRTLPTPNGKSDESGGSTSTGSTIRPALGHSASEFEVAQAESFSAEPSGSSDRDTRTLGQYRSRSISSHRDPSHPAREYRRCLYYKNNDLAKLKRFPVPKASPSGDIDNIGRQNRGPPVLNFFRSTFKKFGTWITKKCDRTRRARRLDITKPMSETDFLTVMKINEQYASEYCSTIQAIEIQDNKNMPSSKENKENLSKKTNDNSLKSDLLPSSKENKEKSSKKTDDNDNSIKSDLWVTLDDLPEDPTEDQFGHVFGTNVSRMLKAAAFIIYKFETGPNKNIQEADRLLVDLTTFIVKFEKCVPPKPILEAAHTSRCIISTRLHNGEHLYPHFPAKNDDHTVIKDNAILIPLMTKTSETLYVLEIWRDHSFDSVEQRLGEAVSVWGSVCLHFCCKMELEMKKYEVTNNLLTTLKCVFQEMLSLDVVIQRILKFVQQLVDADRASLFMVDKIKNELVSSVFDQKQDDDSKEKVKEIRIPMKRGIAGHVATTGELMNISDAYADSRFNREIDEATGYKTTSILCMPVKVDGETIGVVQMVNKRNALNFHKEDINSFDVFESFFGLALHHAKLYETIKRNEQKYKVALEVLSYHNTCKDNEIAEMLEPDPSFPGTLELNNFYLDSFFWNSIQKCKATLVMFNDLFEMKHFDTLDLTRFVLTVRKNYRNVPYHNFHHGWAVAQSMYTMLKSDTNLRFSYKQRLALFVASLCHDLDHRGYTNKYMSETEAPLAAMYTTSTLEHHHFNTTVSILQQDGHNIFSRFSSEEYKEMLGLIKTCILATDLAVFYKNMQHAKEMLSKLHHFDWSYPANVELAMAFSMTAADLSASAKPWDVQAKTVYVIVEEFYTQGDAERAAGRKPIPMMDRQRPDEMPKCQVSFLASTCVPCYKLLKIILPGTALMLDKVEENLIRWTAMVLGRSHEIRKNKTHRRREMLRSTDHCTICDFCGLDRCMFSGNPNYECIKVKKNEYYV